MFEHIAGASGVNGLNSLSHCMNQFTLQQGQSRELHAFPHILEFGMRKNNSIQLNALTETSADNIRIYFITDGKFEWIINQQHHILYPGDLAIVLPGQSFCGEKNILNIGSFYWLHLHTEKIESTGKMMFGPWSGLSENECLIIGKILLFNNTPVLQRLKEPTEILHGIQYELNHQEIGYVTRVNQLIDELLIVIARQSTRQTNPRRDFPQTFMKLEQTLRQNLSHQWTVDEMAALMGMGTTAFTEKVKNYTGFPPLSYLINIRISEAIKLLNRQDVNVTDIALDTGFYSSQHFSTTFKKLTGYTPGEFRKRNSSKKSS